MEPLKTVNEDGTDIIDAPKNPLYDKYDACEKEGFSCMFCGNCPRGDNWHCTDEDVELYKKWRQEYNDYMRLHNPSLYNRTNLVNE